MPDPMNAEDRVAAIELIASYARCIDSGDLDGYVANFIPGGVIEWAGGRAQGHAQIREWVGGLMARGGIGATPARVRHFVGLPQIAGD
ncbi:MAG TPA: nuclear transport factor 2 family protein, partial [Dehalococcoidia bacterium]